MKIFSTLLLATLVIAGCSEGPTFCTAESVPGVEIKVVDKTTGQPAMCGTEAWLIAGSYSEEIDNHWDCDRPDSLNYHWLSGVHERPGRYSILILNDAYLPWSRDNVFVSENDCHVRTVKLVAEMIPAGN